MSKGLKKKNVRRHLAEDCRRGIQSCIDVVTRKGFWVCDALLLAHSRSSRDARIIMKSLRESIEIQNGAIVFLTSFVDKTLSKRQSRILIGILVSPLATRNDAVSVLVNHNRSIVRPLRRYSAYAFRLTACRTGLLWGESLGSSSF